MKNEIYAAGTKTAWKSRPRGPLRDVNKQRKTKVGPTVVTRASPPQRFSPPIYARDLHPSLSSCPHCPPQPLSTISSPDSEQIERNTRQNPAVPRRIQGVLDRSGPRTSPRIPQFVFLEQRHTGCGCSCNISVGSWWPS